MPSKEEVLRIVKDQNIRFIRLWFTDVLGFLKSFTITKNELEAALNEGAGFDGSSIEGFSRIEESDMMAVPDPKTFQILPANVAGGEMARMFCDIVDTDGRPYEGDPRYILKKNLERAAKLGYTFYVGPELEYFYFKSPDQPIILEKGGYFDLSADTMRDVRREAVAALEDLGIPIECSHHEVAPSQHEIDFRYNDALTMGDNVMTYRLVVKETAAKHGLHATFMPKPIYGINGSGMHVHQSLFKGSENAFFDPKDKYHLSKIGRSYIAGLIKHAREITLVLNQWVNSYKRLVPGYEAPVYICWAHMNRSALVRVPAYKKGKEKATRAEFRSPDPACNPYLAFSVMLAAGLEGIEKGYDLAEPQSDNIYEMTDEERKASGIESLPGDLGEAIHVMQKSELVKKALGEKVYEFFLRNKKKEWEDYRAQVTQFELERYLPVL